MSIKARGFLDYCPEIEQRILRENLILIFDFDGTLARIRKKANLPRISKKRIGILRRLSRLKDVNVIVLSGRPISFLRKHVPLKKIRLIPERGIYFSRVFSRKKFALKKELLKLSTLLFPITKKFNGAYIELKPTSLVFHFRNVRKARRGMVEKEVIKTAKPFFGVKKDLKLVFGRMILEFLPQRFPDKGDALREIMKIHQGLFIYVGDDETDEPAFKQVSKKGFGVLVSSTEKSSKTAAKYYLNGMSDVNEALKLIYKLKSRGK